MANSKIKNDHVLINTQTGEIVESGIRLEPKDYQKRKQEAKEKSITTEIFKQYQKEELGNFVFLLFGNLDKLSEILNDSELVRYMFIGTYVKKDGILKMDNNISHIDKSKLFKLLNTSKRTFDEFYQKLIDNNLLIEEYDNNKEIINGNVVDSDADPTRLKLNFSFDYAYRGSRMGYKSITGNSMEKYIRLYVNKTRELYNNTDGRSLKRLSIVYKLMRFISWKHNILCFNPEEEDYRRLQLITIGDVVEYVGYSKSKITRFKRDFYSLKSNNDYIFMSLQKGTPDYLKSIIAVNPKFMYGGTDLNEVQWLMKSFSAGDNAKQCLN